MKTKSVSYAVLLSLALFVPACTHAPAAQSSQSNASTSAGRWQVVQAEFTVRSEKYPILLDTQTGETWLQTYDGTAGYMGETDFPEALARLHRLVFVK